MFGRPRSDDFMLHDEEPDLHIMVHERASPLLAHHDVLKLYSRCVKELPRSGSDAPIVWDVRGLIPEDGDGRPFSAAVVERYLDLIYSRVDPSRSVELPASLEEAKPLLLFADAVSSSRLVFEDLAARLAALRNLTLPVRVGGSLRLELVLRGHLYAMSSGLGLMDYPIPYASSETRTLVLQPASELFTAHAQHIPDALADSLEGWLYLTGRLGMVPLTRLLLDFLKSQLAASQLCPFFRSIRRVYSPRVLQCAPPELLLEGFLRDCLSDLPSEVRLEAQGAAATLGSAAAASFLPLELAAPRQVDVTVDRGGRSRFTDGRGNTVCCTMILGGFEAEARARVVADVMARAKAESRGAGTGGGAGGGGAGGAGGGGG
ncbi:hypothetical protein GPECTOR_64g78 [Gonium pectorale]|uniref:Uncharacterized protein n=1 Tax=Gonium pectorale TaxID=33097 RepID=A0A150G442_GONPE|nr:hypothetical protein GPECTOR_64g78 [Gonium pectorale]|eukprot:KXZ44659.1 hypothetical protein GPECTOR_64g78 [Gonium pectorale]